MATIMIWGWADADFIAFRSFESVRRVVAPFLRVAISCVAYNRVRGGDALPIYLVQCGAFALPPIKSELSEGGGPEHA
jgi:hypothetical protein